MTGSDNGANAGSTGRLEVRGVRKAFGDRLVLNDIDLSVAPGEIVSLVGPSGSGKSTLLGILTGAIEPDAGSVRFADAPVPERNRPFAYMPQRDVLMPWRTVLDNAGIGLEVAGQSRAKARQEAGTLFAPFGLAGTEYLYPQQLSGGMRQRVAFLRTVVQRKPVLLLDEPFGALDAITRDELQRWLLEIWQRHAWGILLITHDIREAVRLSDRILILPSVPGPLLGDVRVTRDIPRKEGFVTDPRVPELEATLQDLLRQAAATRGASTRTAGSSRV